jgi:hypothetical protein
MDLNEIPLPPQPPPQSAPPLLPPLPPPLSNAYNQQHHHLHHHHQQHHGPITPPPPPLPPPPSQLYSPRVDTIDKNNNSNTNATSSSYLNKSTKFQPHTQQPQSQEQSKTTMSAVASAPVTPVRAKKEFDAKSLEIIQKRSMNIIINELKSVIRNDLCKKLIEQRAFQLIDDYYKQNHNSINSNLSLGTMSSQNTIKSSEPSMPHQNSNTFKRNLSNNTISKTTSNFVPVKRPTTPPSPPPLSTPVPNVPPNSQATPQTSYHNSPSTPSSYNLFKEVDSIESPNFSSSNRNRAPQYFRYPSQQQAQSQVRSCSLLYFIFIFTQKVIIKF